MPLSNAWFVMRPNVFVVETSFNIDSETRATSHVQDCLDISHLRIDQTAAKQRTTQQDAMNNSEQRNLTSQRATAVGNSFRIVSIESVSFAFKRDDRARRRSVYESLAHVRRSGAKAWASDGNRPTGTCKRP